MKYATIFLAIGLLCFVGMFLTDGGLSGYGLTLFRGAWASIGVSCVGVGLAYAGGGAKLLLKRPDGTLHAMSYLVYWPYHLLNQCGLLAVRLWGKENAFDEITPTLLLGRHLTANEAQRLLHLGVGSVLDLTGEFAETPPLRSLPGYRCLPLLDTEAPTLEQLTDGVLWLQERTREGAVYVHCALGHGRSATFVASYLLHTGLVQTADDALLYLKRIRPGVGLSPAQFAAIVATSSRVS